MSGTLGGYIADDDDAGAVVVLFALLLPFVVLLLGGALDYARMLEARTRLQSMTESTLSNVASHIRRGMVHRRQQLKALFSRHMRAEFERRLRKKGVELNGALIRRLRHRLEVTVKARVRTPFLGIAGWGWMPITAHAFVRIAPTSDAAPTCSGVSGAFTISTAFSSGRDSAG